MIAFLGLCFVWTVGLRDCFLTAGLVQSGWHDGELNPLARWISTALGAGGLLALKLAGLALFTIVVLVVRRRCEGSGLRLVAAGMTVSALVSLWWEFTLYSWIVFA